MKRLNTILAALLLTVAALAQDKSLPEYGDISELKDKRRVYVTSYSADTRKRVVDEVKKYSGLEVVNSPDDAEFVLTLSVVPGSSTSTLTASVTLPTGRQRVLWAEDETQSGVSKPNSVNLARHFIKALKKARRVK